MGEPRRRQGEEHDTDGTGEDKEALRSLLTEAEVEQYYSRMVRHGIMPDGMATCVCPRSYVPLDQIRMANGVER